MTSLLDDDFYMKLALAEATRAQEMGEVPIGAVIICEGSIIARSHNLTEQLRDPTAHAEMMAITSATDHLGAKWLNQCTLYVTIEPCVMCAGALYWSRIGRVVYGAGDDKRGFMKYGRELLHPSTKLEFGVQYDACRLLMSYFFQQRR